MKREKIPELNQQYFELNFIKMKNILALIYKKYICYYWTISRYQFGEKIVHFNLPYLKEVFLYVPFEGDAYLLMQ